MSDIQSSIQPHIIKIIMQTCQNSLKDKDIVSRVKKYAKKLSNFKMPAAKVITNAHYYSIVENSISLAKEAVNQRSDVANLMNQFNNKVDASFKQISKLNKQAKPNIPKR
jgi:hypothetical protein